MLVHYLSKIYVIRLIPRTRPFNRYKPLIARPLFESPDCAWYSLHLFFAKAFPLLLLLMLRFWHSSRWYIFNVFIYDAVLGEHWTHHLPDSEHFVLCHGRRYIYVPKLYLHKYNNTYIWIYIICFISSKLIYQYTFTCPNWLNPYHLIS